MSQQSQSDSGKLKFTSAKAVAEWLSSQGWKISSISVQKHVKIGKLSKENGVYNEDTIIDYATKWLKRADTGRKSSGNKVESLQEQKLRADIDASRARAAKAKFALEVAKGAYVPRGDFERELAARAAVLEHGLRNLVESSAAEMIALCSGDMGKTQDVIEWMLERLEICLHEYATLKQWHVIQTRPAQENAGGADYKRFKLSGTK